jgi:ATP-dependent DNA helicase RecG
VGTHTLLDPALTPPTLGLVVIDEQHRFGVGQRLAMVAGRSPSPHLLVVSATPIPRTLALAQYGDLDVVTLAERPAGRQEVTTRLVEPGDRAFVLRTMTRALEADGRVFVVVPRIDPETDDGEDTPRVGASVADTRPWLEEALGPDRVAVVHGRMSAEAQREALDDFRRGVRPVLLGTTVVEVGLDVPAANLMVVLGAEQFGVAQLHQLRGRVGRSGQRAGCLLVPDAAPSAGDPDAHSRLAEVAACTDGFVLAERDLARRGAGEWFGARQSGADSTLRFADPVRDVDLVRAARDIARRVVASDPNLVEHPALARAVRRFLRRGASPVGEEAG